MARLPTRRELADKIDKLERDLAIAATGAGLGAGLARSATARSAAFGAARAVSPYALAVDALIREEESLLGRGVSGLGAQTSQLAQALEAKARAEGLPILGQPAVSRPKQKKSKFNKAITQGMKTVKASTSYGKKGIISSPKKAFSAVVKTASSVKRTGKVAKSGIRRKIGLAIRKIL